LFPHRRTSRFAHHVAEEEKSHAHFYPEARTLGKRYPGDWR
jgi:hypothetical protein